MTTNRLKRFVWPAYVVVLLATAGSTLVVMGTHAVSGKYGHHTAAAPGHSHNGNNDADALIPPDADCQTPGSTINVTVLPKGFSPAGVTAALCDRLVIQNNSDIQVVLAFGRHDHHLSYPGFNEQTVPPGASVSGVLQARGSFELHDHLKDETQAQLTIK